MASTGHLWVDQPKIVLLFTGRGGEVGESKTIVVECHYKYDSGPMFANSVVFLLC